MHATAAIISLTAFDLIHPRQQQLPGQLLVADPDCRHARAPSGGTPPPPRPADPPWALGSPSHSSVLRRHSHGPLPLVLGTLPHWRRYGSWAPCAWARPPCWPGATWRPAPSPYRGRSPRPATAAPSPCPRLPAAGWLQRREKSPTTKRGWVFPGQAGQPLSVRGAQVAITKLAEKLGIEGVSSHSLRRSALTAAHQQRHAFHESRRPP